MANPTIKEALKEASLILKNKKEATLLLQHTLKCDTPYLILKEDEILTEYKIYKELVKRRSFDEPIEYLTNSVSFYSKEFFIKKGALIPRPETELLIDKALDISKKMDKTLHVGEIGTGSGIIACMLAMLIDDIKIIATDISNDALEIARINAQKFGVMDKITFVQTNYLDGIYDNFDMIISNPPYIAEGFELENSLSYEPQNALFGGIRGDEMLMEIIDLWIKREIPYLLCEIGYDQKKPLKRYLRGKDIKQIGFYKDLSSFDRGFVAKLEEK